MVTLTSKPRGFGSERMTDELHRMGFKVMLWVAPYVSPDSPEFRELEAKGYLLKDKTGARPLFIGGMVTVPVMIPQIRRL